MKLQKKILQLLELLLKIYHFASNRNEFFDIEAKRTSLIGHLFLEIETKTLIYYEKTFLSNRSKAVY